MRRTLVAVAMLVMACLAGSASPATASAPALSHRLVLPNLAADSAPSLATLTLQRTGDGSVTGGDGAIACVVGCETASAAFPPGTVVTLTARPGPGATVAWDGCMRVEGLDCIVTMAGPPVVVTAAFTTGAPTGLNLNCRPGTVIVGGFVTCTPDLPGTVTSVEWLAFGGEPVRGQSPASFTTAFASTGAHAISLTACTDEGCGTSTAEITVLPGTYTATLTANGLDDATVAPGGLVEFCYALTPPVASEVRIWTTGQVPNVLIHVDANDGSGGCNTVHLEPSVTGKFTYRADFVIDGVIVAQDTTSFRVE